MLKIAKALDGEAEFTFSLFRTTTIIFEYATKVRLLAIASHLKLPEIHWDKVIERMVVVVVEDEWLVSAVGRRRS